MSNLPNPPPAQLEHSQKLRNKIIDTIKQKQQITFAEFMQMSLYEPGLGYYSAANEKFGQHGDFITAPEISPLFSRCIAKQCAQVLHQITAGDILEFGAGSGKMAAGILLELMKTNMQPKNYFILEPSAELQQRQQQHLQQTLPEYFQHITWLTRLPEAGFNGIILANEVLDAMPVHKFQTDTFLKEAYVTINNQELCWHYDTPSPHLKQSYDDLEVNLPNNYNSEINLNINAWINSLADILAHGMLLILDYGFPRHEYYHPQRDGGTLMCHYQHHAHPDPLILTGIQDITAHVDFTAVAKAGINAGFSLAGYTNQAAFLLNCGLLELSISDLVHDNTEQQIKLNQQIKLLTSPAEMGELFKALALTKGMVCETLIGFTEHDKRSRL